MAKSKFRPLHDRVVVKRIDAEEKTKGGIIIPDSAKEKPSQGEITAVGPGGRDEAGKLIPIDLKVGDRVLFGKWSPDLQIDRDQLAGFVAAAGADRGNFALRESRCGNDDAALGLFFGIDTLDHRGQGRNLDLAMTLSS